VGAPAGCAPAGRPIRGSPAPERRGWSCIRLYVIDNLHHALPRKQLRVVQAWIELHRDELLADWELASSGEHSYKIAPL